MIKAGDMVEVVNSGQFYPTYYDWVEKYTFLTVNDYDKQEYDPLNGEVGQVLVTAPHGDYSDRLLAFISIVKDNGKKYYYIIGELGLKVIDKGEKKCKRVITIS